ncbi:hypothetical protein GCM10008015_00200 [Flavobacterium palustre]|uniref:Glycosyl transferase n=1 Tax=Flavobacterium palustre TaxID=1476463 RepID=A0ABQ1H7Y0_9FLAO|nr:hypothetical protein [Flavobacterium palustre]GGA63277.1 hypothetical protein GCM10008015_00200 [Flavobacterium palustre]
MKKAAFTICAKNYIGLALVLEKSIKKFNSDIEFFIFVADEIHKEDNILDLPKNVIVAKDVVGIEPQTWNQMSFKYDLTEFCTSIKPSCFKYIFEKHNPDSCIYFDPDILVYNSLDCIYDNLVENSIMVTPHITTIETKYTGKLNERSLFYSGMFNLGFLGLKNDDSAKRMLDWWEIRLEDRCFQNMMENYFTDQKWMDFLPSFFSKELLISSNLGLNVAPWNFYEREIIYECDEYLVKNRINTSEKNTFPLTFIHFSGFNYKFLIDDKVTQANIKDLEIYSDYKQPIDIYIEYLKESDFLKYSKLKYSYGSFSNGIQISVIYRKLFRRLFEDGKIDSDPFESSNVFYQQLKKNKILKENMVVNDKVSVNNYDNVERKTILINKMLNYFFKIIGANRFFLLTRLMRLYSKTENHVYLIDKSYFKNFKIRN